jgi:Protein of unknown function (DUF1036)
MTSMLHVGRSLAAAAVLACFPATSALAQQAKPGELVLCNKSAGPIQVAVVYMHAQTGSWTLSAWHTRGPGECKSFGNIRSGLFYYHAKNERGGFWPAQADIEKRYCVPATAVTRDMSSQCGQGDTNRGFKGQKADPGKYTFSFN